MAPSILDVVGEPEGRGQGAVDDGDGRTSWSGLADRRSAAIAEAADREVPDGERPDGSDPGAERTARWRRAARWSGRLLRPVGRLLGSVQGPLIRLHRRLDRSGRALVRLADRPWVLAVAIVNVMVLVAAAAVLLAPDAAPVLPYVPVAGVDEVAEPVLDHDRQILFVPADDGFHAFDAAGSAPRYCPQSDRLESEDGRVWNLRGEPLDGGPPLPEHPLIVHDGTIYLDLSTTEPAARGTDQGAEPACR